MSTVRELHKLPRILHPIVSSTFLRRDAFTSGSFLGHLVLEPLNKVTYTNYVNYMQMDRKHFLITYLLFNTIVYITFQYFCYYY